MTILIAIIVDVAFISLLFTWFWRGPLATENGISPRRIAKCAGLAILAFFAVVVVTGLAAILMKFLLYPIEELVRWLTTT